MKGRNSVSCNLSVFLCVLKLSKVESFYINITILLWDHENSVRNSGIKAAGNVSGQGQVGCTWR